MIRRTVLTQEEKSGVIEHVIHHKMGCTLSTVDGWKDKGLV